MEPALEELLQKCSPAVRELALKTRSLVLEVIPHAVEQVDLSSSLVAYGKSTGMKDTICTILVYKRHVNLGFYHGVYLPDPDRLLEGTGKVHRHVKIRTPADVDRPALRELLQTAVSVKERGIL